MAPQDSKPADYPLISSPPRGRSTRRPIESATRLEAQRRKIIRDPLFRVINDRLYQGVDPDQFELFAVEVVRQDFPSAVPVKGGGGVGVKGGTRTPTGRSSQDPMSCGACWAKLRASVP